MKNASEHPLKQIETRQLSSVEFVQDYVQLRFDGPYLSAFARPIVKMGETKFEYGTPGYCDALCERIGRVVRSVSINENQGIFIDFDDGANISISLEAQDRQGAEAAVFVDGTKQWDSW